MSKIFILNSERRDWKKRVEDSKSTGSNLPVTRRYLMIVDSPEVRDTLMEAYSKAPNAIQPHQSGKDFLFYCIAGSSIRNPAEFIKSIVHKLKSSAATQAVADEMEIYNA